jgi:glycosyltransferase involved in cell wall biosynthesis
MLHAYASHPCVPQPKRWFYMQIEKWLDHFTDHYVAGSDSIRQYGIDHRIMHPNKITRIYNALRQERVNKHYDRSTSRAALGIPSNALVAGAIARLEPQKGLMYFVRAMPLVLQSVPHAHFAIAGDGPLLTTLQDHVRQLGISSRVHFVGWQNDIGMVLSALDAMVLPSLWEAFGIVSLESMAMRVPVIASNVDGIPEVVRDGETGLLVPARDTWALAQAIIALLTDSSRAYAMGCRGREWVLERFTVSSMVAHHALLYQNLVEGSRRKDGSGIKG